jgi:phosphoribosyl-ATP pyrophosphohydrolase/phosphoribosyl-AMP cyclohydrolase
MRDRNAPLTAQDVKTLAWDKVGGLLPAVVQDVATGQVLMLGYMSREALELTLRERFATFHSRSKDRLWQKGETSGHRLAVAAVHADCDDDSLLVLAMPEGPTCHLGTESCFTGSGPRGVGWLGKLARIVHDRSRADPAESYTARLLRDGPLRIAQKVGEEGVELALAGVAGDADACIDEAADLLYHMTVLMEARGFGWDDVAARLEGRHA